jgi:hypothetical protein
MPATERYQVDFFAIVIMIVSVLALVFLIIAAIYFMNLMNLRPPSKTESTFLFWTSVILAVIFLGIIIYAFIRIFTYKSIVYEEDKPVIPTTPQITVQPLPQVVPPLMVQPVPPQPTPPAIMVQPQTPITTRPSEFSQNFSDIPVTAGQSTALNQELIGIQSAFS